MELKRYTSIIILCLSLLSSCSDDIQSSIGNVSSDSFSGNLKTITLQNGMDGFQKSSFTLVLTSDSGIEITRTGTHSRSGGVSTLTLKEGLKSGDYRLLYLTDVDTTANAKWTDYGLGCRIRVNKEETSADVIDSYNSDFQLYGAGNKENPFVICSTSHLTRLRDITNSQISNEMLTDSTYFSQYIDLDLDVASFHAHKLYGWDPIGNQNVCPFRGVYDGNKHKITGLWISRSETCGIGLFGHAESATICNIVVEDASIEGDFAVGSILGAAVTRGDRQSQTNIFNCTTKGGKITGKKGSAAIGGIVGLVDLNARIVIDSCYNKNTNVDGSYGVGGIVGIGSLFSRTSVRGCNNEADVRSGYTGCGGIAGSCDTLYVMSCKNYGKITGCASFTENDNENGGIGSGGIAGGAGRSYFYTCNNYGEVTGHTGVGGILGSTCSSAQNGYYNNAMMKSCGNEASVSGYTSVGGICGEAQFGCYSVYNTGNITALSQSAIAGGIVGNTSVSVVHNAINSGQVNVTSAECIGGIVGKTTWGTLFACQNSGNINSNAKYLGGIVALAGSQTVVNYCANFGDIESNGKGYVGGIIGEVGDPREWSVLNTITCIIGGIDCALGIIGPTLAVSGLEYVQEAHRFEFLLQIENWEKIHKVAHVTELVFDAIALAYDWGLKIYELVEFLSVEEFEELMEEIAVQAGEIDTANTEKIKSLRSSAAENVVLFSGLNKDAVSSYVGNIESLIETYESADGNIEAINYNLCNERETRAKGVHKFKKALEIVHTVFGCVTLAVSTAAFVASFIAAPGSQPAIAMAFVGGVSTVVGGVNAIAENCDDYQENIVSITQCVNMGEITAESAERVGGIAGHLQQFSFMGDCLNTAQYGGTKGKSAGIAGRSDSQSDLFCCLNLGSKWEEPLVYTSHSTSCKATYFLAEAFPDRASTSEEPSIKLNNLADKSKYPGSWDFSSAKPVWSVVNKSGEFPVPKHSKMETKCY
ncbi:MAG: hypothetical protein ACI30S_08795 [Muribaculaceae bacterium]